MKVVVNGEIRELSKGATVAKVIEMLGRDPAGRGIAVALNGDVVARGTWQDTLLQDDDKVEVLAAVGGG
jgi:sulfur carrier protein